MSLQGSKLEAGGGQNELGSLIKLCVCVCAAGERDAVGHSFQVTGEFWGPSPQEPNTPNPTEHSLRSLCTSAVVATAYSS